MSLNYSIGSISSAPIHLSLYWTILTFAFGRNFTMLFHLTRCTLSYACYVLREIIDHSGLPSTTVLEFTRTSPCCNAFQEFLQPHDDNYHLLHHLLPKIPMSRLHESHVWLVSNVPFILPISHFPFQFCVLPVEYIIYVLSIVDIFPVSRWSIHVCCLRPSPCATLTLVQICT